MVGYICSQINQVWWHLSHNYSTLIFIFTFVSKTGRFVCPPSGGGGGALMKITIVAKSNIQYENRTWNTYMNHWALDIWQESHSKSNKLFINTISLHNYDILTLWCLLKQCCWWPLCETSGFILGEEPRVQLFSTSTNPNTSALTLQENTFCKDTPHCSELSLHIPWIQRKCIIFPWKRRIPFDTRESLKSKDLWLQSVAFEGILCFQRTPRTC